MAGYGAEIGRGLVLGDVSSDCKPIVIGIDFGTAYSGIAFALKNNPGHVRYGAPNVTFETQTKVPTVLLELPGDVWEFGHVAESKYNELLSEAEEGADINANLYRRYKMALRGKTTGFDSLKVVSTGGKSTLLMKLVVKTLEILKDYAIELATPEFGGRIDPLQDVQWVLTVPAIWNDFGKAFMRKAAFKAGMMEDEQSENLMLVLEPEGASLAVHVGASQHGLLGAGSRFMVLDCGGGTIDITVHEVQTVRPLELKAIAAPSGDDSGGEKVHTMFRAFLKEFLGPALFQTHGQALLNFYTIYTEFEKILQHFDPAYEPANLNIVDVLDRKDQLMDLVPVWNRNHPDRPVLTTNPQLLARGTLKMSSELMLSFFEPSMRAIVDQAKAALRTTPGVRYMMVVGGFGASKVLIQRVREEFNGKNGMKVICPDPNPKPQGAIVHGAVYFGLHKDIVASRVAAYTYGVAVRENGVDDVFRVLVRRGQELPNKCRRDMIAGPVFPDQTDGCWRVYYTEVEYPRSVTEGTYLDSLVAHFPPHEDPAQRLQTGVFVFGGTELHVSVQNSAGVVKSRGFLMKG